EVLKKLLQVSEFASTLNDKQPADAKSYAQKALHVDFPILDNPVSTIEAILGGKPDQPVQLVTWTFNALDLVRDYVVEQGVSPDLADQIVQELNTDPSNPGAPKDHQTIYFDLQKTAQNLYNKIVDSLAGFIGTNKIDINALGLHIDPVDALKTVIRA